MKENKQERNEINKNGFAWDGLIKEYLSALLCINILASEKH